MIDAAQVKGGQAIDLYLLQVGKLQELLAILDANFPELSGRVLATSGIAPGHAPGGVPGAASRGRGLRRPPGPTLLGMDAHAWDERYAASDLVWSREPNRFVAAELADLPPGSAVDLAAGEGRNAIWLAARRAIGLGDRLATSRAVRLASRLAARRKVRLRNRLAVSGAVRLAGRLTLQATGGLGAGRAGGAERQCQGRHQQK